MDPDGIALQEMDEQMRQEMQKSCHILPIDSSNFYHDHNKYNVKGHSRLDDGDSSAASDVDQAISIQEDYEDDDDNKDTSDR